MKCNRQILFFSLLLGMIAGVEGLASHAGAAPAFTIAATNVTMPMTGPGSTQYTVTAIPLTGTVYVSCQYTGTETGLKLPDCNYGPPHAPTSVTAGQTVQGTILFYPYGPAVPAGLRRTRTAPWAGLTLAVALFYCMGLRRRARGWLALSLLAAATFAGLAGITSCGGNPNAMTPGTYQFTISADNESDGNAPLGQGVNTTISVTVP